jgi:hypothetical protein
VQDAAVLRDRDRLATVRRDFLSRGRLDGDSVHREEERGEKESARRARPAEFGIPRYRSG